MKILIVGINGFIGSHLRDFFIDNGHIVFGCDVKDKPEAENYFRVDRFASDYRFAVKSTQPDLCIFAGGNGSVPVSIQDPKLDFELNTVNVYLLLEALRLYAPAAKFLHISSAAVYGNPTRLPIHEDAPLQPLSPYGWHKVYSERLCYEFYKEYKIASLSLRVFSVYGERLKKQLFWDIAQKSRLYDPIELFGSGEETRDFIYIDDLVKAISIISSEGSFNGTAINVASGKQTTIRNAAELLCLQLGASSPVFNGITKKGDPLYWQADITQLQNHGFEVSLSLQEGLSRYALWLKENTLL